MARDGEKKAPWRYLCRLGWLLFVPFLRCIGAGLLRGYPLETRYGGADADVLQWRQDGVTLHAARAVWDDFRNWGGMGPDAGLLGHVDT